MTVIARATHPHRFPRPLQHHTEATALAADHPATEPTVVFPHEEAEGLQTRLALRHLAVRNPNRGRIHVRYRQLLRGGDSVLASACGRGGYALRLQLVFPKKHRSHRVLLAAQVARHLEEGENRLQRRQVGRCVVGGVGETRGDAKAA
mgnify:FL=1